MLTKENGGTFFGTGYRILSSRSGATEIDIRNFLIDDHYVEFLDRMMTDPRAAQTVHHECWQGGIAETVTELLVDSVFRKHPERVIGRTREEVRTTTLKYINQWINADSAMATAA